MKLNRRSAWTLYLQEAEKQPFDAGNLPDAISNGSFEDGEGNLPADWTLLRGEIGVSTEWCASDGCDGRRCLRMTPWSGGASWLSRAVAVTSGAQYVFRCRMRRAGEPGWAEGAEISWVGLVFYDAAGRPLPGDEEYDRPLLLVRAHSTDGWVDAWRYLVAPEGAVALRVNFRLDRGEPELDDPYLASHYGAVDTGDWWIDDVRLDRMPWPIEPARGTLCIHTTGGDARLRVTDTRGETYAPPDAFAYCGGEGCFHTPTDDTRVSLPPGGYTVEAMRGFQREPFSKAVEVVEGHECRVSVELPRVADWAAHGWYAGDHHCHLAFDGRTRYPLMGIDDVYRIARGEGLDYLSFCGDLHDQHAYAEWRDAGRPRDARPDGAFERDDFVGTVSFEARNDLLGHLCLVNAPGRVAPAHPEALVPTGTERALLLRRSDARGTRGALAVAHPFAGLDFERITESLADPSRTRCYRELPVDAALGFGDVIDILTDEASDLEQALAVYYRLLNLGLRLGVSGSSGACVDRGDELLGSLATFVRAERLNMDCIAAGYEAHRTMASNGPLLRLRVNDKEVGATVIGPDVRIQAEAFSNWGLTRLEVLYNGKVIADATPGEMGWGRVTAEWCLERSGWMLARATGPAHPVLNAKAQHAITSPIYVEVPGRPLLPNREDADYFIRWTYACIEAIQAWKAALPPGAAPRDEEITTALNLFRRGRVFFEDLRDGS